MITTSRSPVGRIVAYFIATSLFLTSCESPATITVEPTAKVTTTRTPTDVPTATPTETSHCYTGCVVLPLTTPPGCPGSYLAFFASTVDEVPDDTGLLVYCPETKHLTMVARIMDERRPDGVDISHDGKAVLTVDYIKGTRSAEPKIEGEGLTIYVFHNVTQPQWSPDERLVSYVEAFGAGSIAIVDMQTKNRSYVADTSEVASNQWSPDGTMMLYVETVDPFHGEFPVYIASITCDVKCTTDETRPIANVGIEPSWGSDPLTIISVPDDETRYILRFTNLDGVITREINGRVLQPRILGFRQPMLSPDGKYVAFIGFSSDDLEWWDLFVLDLLTMSLTNLTGATSPWANPDLPIWSR